MTPFKLLLLAMFGSTFAAAQAPPPVVIAPSPKPKQKTKAKAKKPAKVTAPPPPKKTVVFDYRPKEHPAPKAKPKPKPVVSRPAPKPRRKLTKDEKIARFRAEVVKIPGTMWEPLEPVDSVARKMADALRDQLWDTGAGSTLAVPMDDGRILGFLAVGEDDGVSIWKLKPGTVVPSGGFPPKAAPEEEDEPEAPLEPEEADAIEQIREQEPEEPAEIIVEPEEPEVVINLPTLMQGSTGEDVVTLQKALGITGNLGTFGPMTVDKVRAFQRSKGLEDDGVVGPLTWKALFAP